MKTQDSLCFEIRGFKACALGRFTIVAVIVATFSYLLGGSFGFW
jgi:hypothetical protein